MTAYEMAVAMRTLGQEAGAEFLACCKTEIETLYGNDRITKRQVYYVEDQVWDTLTDAMHYWQCRRQQYAMRHVGEDAKGRPRYEMVNATTGKWVCDVRKLWPASAPRTANPYVIDGFSTRQFPNRDKVLKMGPVVETLRLHTCERHPRGGVALRLRLDHGLPLRP